MEKLSWVEKVRVWLLFGFGFSRGQSHVETRTGESLSSVVNIKLASSGILSR